ncbi:TcaA second domain-containing protein [Staphylococcus warneri]|uniref:TcaA second domain-containing protein n=1 Tax=Staphylococcus warneri TaxID=1292 RepID=UPI001A90C653|nr:hypothetical protein [Staphylococcus warneri]MBO0377060.1 hypothetical protein [Staphylococcus warneri]
MPSNESSQNEPQYSRLTDEERALLEKDKKRKRKWIKWGIIIGAIIIIGVVVYIYASSKSAKGQIDEFEKAVDKRDYTKLLELMKSNEQEINKTDMKHFVDYVKKPENKKQYQKDMKAIKDKVKNGEKYDPDVGQLKDKNGHTMIDVSKDGARFLFINRIAFEPKFYKVYVKGYDNKAVYEFKNNNKARKVVAPAHQDTELGAFMVGDYDVDATKSYKDKDSPVEGNLDGRIHINTDDIGKNKKIYANEQFGEAWFKVAFENTQTLDKKDYTLMIDDKKVDYKKDKVYGKFPADTYFTVKGQGQMSGEVINTDEVEVEANKNKAPQTIKLTFKQNEIKKQQKKDKEIEKGAKDFLEDYTDRLSTGYQVSDFSGVESMFEDKNSDVAKSIKKQVKSKKEHKYSKPKIKSYKRDGNEITVVLSKKDEDDNVITSQYTLSYDESSDEYKIKDYTDV